MPSRNVEVAQQAWVALQENDLDAFLGLMDPEIEFVSLIAEAEGRTYRGHDGVREWWRTVSESLGGLRYDVQEFGDLGEGRVLTRVVVSGTVAEVEVPQMMWHLSEVRKGKAVWWSVFRSENEARESADSRRSAE